jgi:hypothetical protein
MSSYSSILRGYGIKKLIFGHPKLRGVATPMMLGK